jgi:hypothetical protein
MLTGTRAFAREHTVDTLHAILHEAPSEALLERPGVPAALGAIVARLLEKSPDARYRSAATLIDALERVDVGDHRRSAGIWSRRAIRRLRGAAPSRRVGIAGLASIGVATAIATAWP